MPKFTSFVRDHFLVVCLLLALALGVGWFVVRLGEALHIANETFNVSLANDAETGKYLGEVVEKIRDERTGKVIYQIKRSDGSVLERRSETVVLFEP